MANKSRDTKSKVVEQLRACLPKRGRRSFIQDLQDNVILAIYQRWRRGYNDKEVARWLHEEGMAPGASIHSTAVVLGRYKKRIAHLLIQTGATPTESAAQYKIDVPSIRQIDSEAQNQGLVGLKRTRDEFKKVVDAMNVEAFGGIPHKQLADLNNTLIRYDEKILKMEIEQAKLGKPLRNYSTPANQQIWRSLIDCFEDDGSALLEAADMLLQDVAENAQTLEILEDGTYNVRPATDAEKIQDLSLGVCGGIALPHNLEKDVEGI